jgi:hypothetical protein
MLESVIASITDDLMFQFIWARNGFAIETILYFTALHAEHNLLFGFGLCTITTTSLYWGMYIDHNYTIEWYAGRRCKLGSAPTLQSIDNKTTL